MDRELYELLQQWQQSHGTRRTVKIEMDYTGGDSIFVYDYDLMSGALIKSKEQLETLDLLKEKRSRLEKELAQCV